MRKLAFLVALICLGLSAAAEDSVTFDDSNPPYMFQKDGKPSGLYPSLTAEAFKRAGAAVAIKTAPWKRAVASAEAGESALGGCYMNADRSAAYDFTDKLYDETLILIVLKGKSFPFATANDLKGKRIGVMAGWSYGDDFDKAKAAKLFTVDEADSDDANIKKLLAGRVDVIIMDKLAAAGPFAAALASAEALPKPLQQLSTYVIFKKSLNKKDLIAKFNAALKAMRADGTYDKIVASIK